MNTVMLNTVHLDGAPIIKKGSGGGGGVTINNQSKSVDIVENGTTEIVADSGYTGIGKVTVNVNVPSSGGDVESKMVNDVTFYDYDGVVLHSYTKEEFLALTELPPLPTRKGLICQEWNWNYEDAIAYVSEYGILDVGATYITDDGTTRLYISITEEEIKKVTIYFKQSLANGVAIDWGDGSAPQTLSSTGKVNTAHTYAEVGEYVITLSVADGCELTLGWGMSGSSTYGVFGKKMSEPILESYLTKIELGERSNMCEYMTQNAHYSNFKTISIPHNGILPRQCFSNSFLTSLVIPKGVSTVNDPIYNSLCLKKVIYPRGITALMYPLRYNYSLKTFVIPDDWQSLYLQNCISLKKLVVPKSVSDIVGVSSGKSLIMCDFSHYDTIPSLTSDGFSSLSSSCKIIVPDALYDEWIAATNWSSLASKIIKKSDWDASQA